MIELLQEAGLRIENGKIVFPVDITRVKIDVGLSVNAPQSQSWISGDPNLFVLGFEPLESNLDSIRNASSQWLIKLLPEFISHRIALIKTALYSAHLDEGMLFHVTRDDPGCSSLLAPKSFDVLHTERVDVWTLNDVLDFFPFDRVPVIDHLKIDAQGADFEIIKGASRYLDKFFAITLEVDTTEYKETTNSQNDVESFMIENGFIKAGRGFFAHLNYLVKGYRIDVETDDPTFINLNQIQLSKNRRFLLYQRG